MEVNKCTRMEGVFHSRTLTMGPLLPSDILYLYIPAVYHMLWMNVMLSGPYIYSRRWFEICLGHKRHRLDLRSSIFVPLDVLLWPVLFFFVFKRQYCRIFFFTKALFCAPFVTNCCRSAGWPGSLWVMSSQSCLRVVLPSRHISAYPHHGDEARFSLVSLTCSFSYTFLDYFIEILSPRYRVQLLSVETTL